MTVAPYAILLCAILPLIKGHGRLIEPPSRASAWRYGFDTPHNYNDHELFCGGYTTQWVKNEGKCGVCGDSWNSKLPRPHEYGGTYGQGVIVRKYAAASVVNIRVELTANHYGYFVFSVCPDYKTTSQECLDKHILKTARPQENLELNTVRYYPKDGNKVYEMKYKLPKMTCAHCVLQWRYIAGNNWGNCPNGTGAVGCGPQEEFRACADISIGGKGIQEVTTQQPELSTRPQTSEESYSPISAIIVSIVSFLVVFLILSLLYFHYYQIGKNVKSWIKGKSGNKTGSMGNKQLVNSEVPVPPPRVKRTKSISIKDDKMEDVNLHV